MKIRVITRRGRKQRKILFIWVNSGFCRSAWLSNFGYFQYSFSRIMCFSRVHFTRKLASTTEVDPKPDDRSSVGLVSSSVSLLCSAHDGVSSSLAVWLRGWLSPILDNAVGRATRECELPEGEPTGLKWTFFHAAWPKARIYRSCVAFSRRYAGELLH